MQACSWISVCFSSLPTHTNSYSLVNVCVFSCYSNNSYFKHFYINNKYTWLFRSTRIYSSSLCVCVTGYMQKSRKNKWQITTHYYFYYISLKFSTCLWTVFFSVHIFFTYFFWYSVFGEFFSLREIIKIITRFEEGQKKISWKKKHNVFHTLKMFGHVFFLAKTWNI